MSMGLGAGILAAAAGGTTIGRGVIDVGVSSQGVRSGMKGITSSIQGESKLWGAAFRGAMMGLQAIVVGVGATMVASVSQAEQFNAAMARVASFADLGEGSTAKLNQRLKQLHDTLLAM